MRSIELFSGCGGLALGTARAGFEHVRMVEWNADACATLAHNKAANQPARSPIWTPEGILDPMPSRCIRSISANSTL